MMEGATRLFPPPANLQKGPRQPGERAKGQPFYNPGMALNRDLSVLLVEAFARARGREIDVADALAGTGARSLRLTGEVEAPIIVHANDADPRGVAAMRAHPVGARLRIHEGDAHAFLATQRFDVIDLDPCGSPMPFVDAAMRAARVGALVCATATDTGALAGKFPRVCRRRYDAHHGLHPAPWRAEVGLRVLGGALVRSAARFERVATPVLSIASGHWMRVVARVEEGKKDTDDGLRGLRNAVLDADGLGRMAPAHEVPDGKWAGPLWGGPLHDAGLVAAMRAAREGKQLARPKEADALLALFTEEADAPAFWVEPDLFQKRLGPPPRRDVLIARLRAAGFAAARAHLDAQGVRTDAGLDGLRACWGG
jgi:tRNA (guanine26-N2/guanine27-N2)-dimethyltransferase